MITIKTIWLYSALVASLLVGTGAGYMISAPDADLSRQLRLANEQIEIIARNCIREKEVYKRGEVTHSPSRGF